MAADPLHVAIEARGLREPSSSDSKDSECDDVKELRYRASLSAFENGMWETVRASRTKLRNAAEYSRKDSQRSRNLKEMSKAIFQLAHTLKIDLPPVRYKAGKLNVSQLSIHKRGFSNRSSSRQSWRTGGCEGSNLVQSMTSDFAAWTQAQDMHTVSLIAVLCAALHRCPQAVADAWHDALNSSVCQLPLLSALIFHMTGYVPSAQQVENTKILLDPYDLVSQRIGNLCLAALQLSAVGCSSTVCTRHSVRPCDMLRKCAQFAAEAGLSADQLWEIVEDGKQKAGSTGVDGIVRLGRQALPSLSRNKLAKLAALLVVETEQFSTSGQVDRSKFLDEMQRWINMIQAVAIPPCIAEADHLLIGLGRSEPPSPRLHHLPANTSPDPTRCGSPSLRTASPFSIGACSPSSALAGSSLQTSSKAGDATVMRSQASAFRAWLSSVDSTSVSCFQVFKQCYALAPRLLAHVFSSVSGSHAEVPTEAIGNVFERLVAHPPHERQADQLKMFLDVQVRDAHFLCSALHCLSRSGQGQERCTSQLGGRVLQGDKRITMDEIRYLLPAICSTVEKTGLGCGNDVCSDDVLDRIALWCSYCNTSPSQLCKALDVSCTGHLGRKSIILLLQRAIPGQHDWQRLFQLFITHPGLDTNADRRVSIEEFCTSIRRIQSRWQRAKISPYRGSWKP